MTSRMASHFAKLVDIACPVVGQDKRSPSMEQQLQIQLLFLEE